MNSLANAPEQLHGYATEDVQIPLANDHCRRWHRVRLMVAHIVPRGGCGLADAVTVLGLHHLRRGHPHLRDHEGILHVQQPQYRGQVARMEYMY